VPALFAVAVAVASAQLPGIGAGALLHPGRRPVTAPPPASCQTASFFGDGVRLAGWRCAARSARRGTLIYLHGVADNRMSSAGIVERFGNRGFDVIAYDSRAHGESEGEACTYGFFEKEDLRHVLAGVGVGPIVLVGTSLGAAVALQEAARNPRVSAIVAAETFSDLTTVASERAPFFFTSAAIRRAFALAEAQGRFSVAAVSPLASAASIHLPVLLVHGDADRDTPADHSRRVFAELRGPRRLILVPGAGHNQSLRDDVWREIEEWIDEIVRPED
jgi:pimeloyl-ACP methyl ester carboxylesterase